MNPHALSRTRARRLAHAMAAASLILVASQANATKSGQTPQGWAFVEGGIGQTETQDMEAERGKYSLWVMTAARTSGAHLADVEVSIANDKGEPVFVQRLDGPWLMINLPLGRYEVRSRYGQETQTRTTTIHPGDHHQIVFYFNVPAEVVPKE